QRHRDSADLERAPDACGRPVRVALRTTLSRGERFQERRRSGILSTARWHLLQSPQSHHLRRLERDSTQHHRPDDSRPVSKRALSLPFLIPSLAVRPWTSPLQTSNNFSRIRCSASFASITASRPAARLPPPSTAGAQRCGKSSPISALRRSTYLRSMADWVLVPLRRCSS